LSMAVITSPEGPIAKARNCRKSSRTAGLSCIARESILKASKNSISLKSSAPGLFTDAPSIFHRLTYGGRNTLPICRRHFLNPCRGTMWCTMPGRPLFFSTIWHALKVRIIADERSREVHDDQGRISKEAAERLLKKRRDDRTRWSKHLFGIDTRPLLYDLVITSGR